MLRKVKAILWLIRFCRPFIFSNIFSSESKAGLIEEASFGRGAIFFSDSDGLGHMIKIATITIYG